MPGREVRWREFWYPAHGLGDGFEYATRDVVAQTRREGDVLHLHLLATAEYAGARCIVSAGEKTLLDTPVELTPAAAVHIEVPGGASSVEIRVLAADGSVLLRYVSPLELQSVETPDLALHPARQDGVSTADELFSKAFLLHSQTKPDAAREAYLAVLNEDPLHARALCGLASLALKDADWKGARDYAEKATHRDPNNADAWYALGTACLYSGDLVSAKEAAYKAAFTPDKNPRGYFLAGRVEMLMGQYTEALRMFEFARQGNGFDTAARNGSLAALLALGNTGEAVQLAERAMPQDPVDFTLGAIAALASDSCDVFTQRLARDGGDKQFALQEAACFLSGMGLYGEAARVLEAAFRNGLEDPITRYYAAWCLHKAGRDEAVRAHLEQAASLTREDALPSRQEELPMLEWAVSVFPESGRMKMLLGTLYAHFGRLDEAVTQWQGAVEKDASLGLAWRLLAQQAWKKENNPVEAERCLRMAMEVRPDDQILYRDLALVLEKTRRQEAIALVESMPKTEDMRYDITVWLAQAYVDEERYDDCIALFETASFSNWEAQTRPRDIFVTALLARGRQSFDAGRMEEALDDFEKALTYPENLEVGRPYEVTDAETQYWVGKARWALGRADAAREAWETGAGQRTSDDPALPFVTVTASQDQHVRKCRTALELLTLSGSL